MDISAEFDPKAHRFEPIGRDADALALHVSVPAATISGVTFSAVVTDESAPCSTSRRIRIGSPARAAIRNGVALPSCK